MSIKRKLKSFFRVNKSNEASDTAAELLEKFILPFAKHWNPLASVDDAIAAFFAMDERKFFWGKALKDFKLPGSHLKAGNREIRMTDPALRLIKKNQMLLLAVDRKDQSARVGIERDGKELTFKLTRAQVEFLKDHIEVKEA